MSQNEQPIADLVQETLYHAAFIGAYVAINQTNNEKPGRNVYSTSPHTQMIDGSSAILVLYESASQGPEALTRTLASLFACPAIRLSERRKEWRNILSATQAPICLDSSQENDHTSSPQVILCEHKAYLCIPLDAMVELVLSMTSQVIEETDFIGLLPHISQALRLCHQLNQQQQDLDAIAQVLDHYPLPALAVDNQLNTVFVNKMLRQKFRKVAVQDNSNSVASSREQAREHVDVLKFCHPGPQQSALKEALLCCTRPAQHASVLCSINIAGEQLPIVINPTASIPKVFKHYARSGLAWVYFLDASYSQHLRDNAIFQAFDFSKAEKELCILLFEGKPLAEVARHRNVSEQTVRKQLQSLLRKTQLECQEALILFLFEHCIEFGLTK